MSVTDAVAFLERLETDAGLGAESDLDSIAGASVGGVSGIARVVAIAALY